MYPCGTTLLVHLTTDGQVGSFRTLVIRNVAIMSRRVQISLWYTDLCHFSTDTEVGFRVTWKLHFHLSLSWGGAKPVFQVTSVHSRHWGICTLSSICCLSSKWKSSEERQLTHPGFNLRFSCDFRMLSVSCVYEPRLKPSLEKNFFEIPLQTGSLASLMLR